mmetsp:Transcript_84067/g.216423  ORF Transcript_84067/g.216423 Transcript_84067/m.216423 type:complete len:349 (-) Transcript_84067:2216-3262(-)
MRVGAQHQHGRREVRDPEDGVEAHAEVRHHRRREHDQGAHQQEVGRVVLVLGQREGAEDANVERAVQQDEEAGDHAHHVVRLQRLLVGHVPQHPAERPAARAEQRGEGDLVDGDATDGARGGRVLRVVLVVVLEPAGGKRRRHDQEPGEQEGDPRRHLQVGIQEVGAPALRERTAHRAAQAAVPHHEAHAAAALRQQHRGHEVEERRGAVQHVLLRKGLVRAVVAGAPRGQAPHRVGRVHGQEVRSGVVAAHGQDDRGAARVGTQVVVQLIDLARDAGPAVLRGVVARYLLHADRASAAYGDGGRRALQPPLQDSPALQQRVHVVPGVHAAEARRAIAPAKAQVHITA